MFSDLQRLIRENRVESGLAGGGGGHGGRRGGRGPGRNPKSILTIIASSNLLEIPSKFKELVSRVKNCRSLRRISFELFDFGLVLYSPRCIFIQMIFSHVCFCVSFFLVMKRHDELFPSAVVQFCSLSK